MTDFDKSVLRGMTDERVSEILATPEGNGVLLMLMRNHPWDTFVTLTTSTICTPERMKKIIFRTFGMNRITKGCEYFYVLEPFKNREGVHAHLLVKNMPPYPSWKKTWNWYFNKKGFGRFQSLKISTGNMLQICAYCTKYCLKEIQNGEFGWSTTISGRRHHDHNKHDPAPQYTGTKMRSSKNVLLIRDKADWMASRHHAKQRNIYRSTTEKINGLDRLHESLRAEIGWNAITEAVKVEVN